MSRLSIVRLCINTQTPPVKFKVSYTDLLEKYGQLDDPLDLEVLERGVDYDFSPGGVTAMSFPLLARLVETGYVQDPVWVSLGVNYPPTVKMGGMTVSHVELTESALREYAGFKETLWSLVHGLPERPPKRDEYQSYVRYNWVNADRMLQNLGSVDAFFVQDFQLLLTGQMIGISAPAVLRWHVPFRPENLGRMHRFVLKAMEGFDSMVVSTRRDLEGLIRSSYIGRAYQIYPHVDPGQWRPSDSRAMESLRERTGLGESKLLLCVARMDPMKSQDVAIRALGRLRRRADAKLMLIGNGSFSSSSSGGLGRDKGAVWKANLRQVARDAGVEDRVVFLGYASDEDVRAAYGLASAVVVSSAIEGFGITALESWVSKKPVVVSKGAGASELVVEGSNGYTFEPGDDVGLADAAEKALGSKGEQMGENGYETAKQCWVDEAAAKVKVVMEDTLAGF